MLAGSSRKSPAASAAANAETTWSRIGQHVAELGTMPQALTSTSTSGRAGLRHRDGVIDIGAPTACIRAARIVAGMRTLCRSRWIDDGAAISVRSLSPLVLGVFPGDGS